MTGLDSSRANTTCARVGAYKADLFAKCLVELGEVGLIALPPPARSNGSCSFPASRFPMWVALMGEDWAVDSHHPALKMRAGAA